MAKRPAKPQRKKSRGSPGRPAKRSEEVRQRLLGAISSGNTFRVSCLYAGISEDTFGRWRKTDADFAESVKKAEAMAIVRNVAIIQKAADETWQAAAWWLERRYPENWARRERFEHAVSHQINLSALTDGEIRMLEGIVRKAGPPALPGAS